MKNFEKLKSHFAFTRGEQGGILILSLCIAFVWGIKAMLHQPPVVSFDMNSPEIRAWQKELDSLKNVADAKAKPKLYPFNPNFISDYKGYRLGLSTEAMDCLFAFREEGNWIRSASDFQKLTGVSDTWLDSIAPYFKFPNFSNGRSIYPKSATSTNGFPKNKIDLNTATQEELMQVPGIGAVFSRRIMNFRQQYGGFTDVIQLYSVYGLKEASIPQLLKYVTIKNPVPIQKKNIYDMSASDLATLPGISFDLGVKIWEFVRQENTMLSLDELQKIDEITPQKIALIRLYLSVGPKP